MDSHRIGTNVMNFDRTGKNAIDSPRVGTNAMGGFLRFCSEYYGRGACNTVRV